MIDRFRRAWRLAAGAGLGALLLQVLASSPSLAGPAAAGEPVWVFLLDKPDGSGGRVPWQGPPEDRSRRELDLPVDPHYAAAISGAGIEVRFRSRWFNALTVSATPAQQGWLDRQDFVRHTRPVRRHRRGPKPDQPEPGRALKQGAPLAPRGASDLEQLALIGVPDLHDQGYRGLGVRIALLDNGFHYAEHPAFAAVQVVAARDFVNDDPVVSDETDQPVTGDETVSNQNIHGAQVLSVLAGLDPGNLVGVAPEAEYILAKTEDLGSEWPIEEDRWIAGLEWADSLEADIVNSSLGYNTWDDGGGYTYGDLDGATALTTVAAEMAVARGIIVVAAAGNEANGPWYYVLTPADAPGVISVGAVALDGSIAGFSSRGPTSDGRIKPDVVAPGVGVVVADIRAGGYRGGNGTSFAAPLVSGVCALLLQAHPDWGPERMQQVLRVTATDLGPAGEDTQYGWGLVNALRAIDLEAAPPISSAGGPFPNPATLDEVRFPLELAAPDRVALRIFDLSGGLIDQVQAPHPEGAGQTLSWPVPAGLANGLYYYRLTGSRFSRSGKIAVVR